MLRLGSRIQEYWAIFSPCCAAISRDIVKFTDLIRILESNRFPSRAPSEPEPDFNLQVQFPCWTKRKSRLTMESRKETIYQCGPEQQLTNGAEP